MKKNILVIEDDRIVRENIVTLLTEEGFSVSSSSSGNEGIDIARQQSPDLIICDVMMPGISGFDVLQELSADELTRSIPFIFLTAKVEKENIRKGMNLGAADYLLKPFDVEDLLNSVSSRLKRAEILKADHGNGREADYEKNYAIDDKLFVQVNKKPVLINIADILFINAERQYTSLAASEGKTYLLRKSITYWESILPEKFFLRIHRSTIININFVSRIEPWFNSSYKLYLKHTQDSFIVSRRYAAKLRGNFFR